MHFIEQSIKLKQWKKYLEGYAQELRNKLANNVRRVVKRNLLLSTEPRSPESSPALLNNQLTKLQTSHKIQYQQPTTLSITKTYKCISMGKQWTNNFDQTMQRHGVKKRERQPLNGNGLGSAGIWSGGLRRRTYRRHTIKAQFPPSQEMGRSRNTRFYHCSQVGSIAGQNLHF